MPRASCWGWATPLTRVAVAFSAPPTLPPIGLVPPGTPRLNEPMFRRKASRYWEPTGLPKSLGGVVSVKMVLAAGGGVKLRLLTVQFVPPWQLWQPAWAKSVRPLLIVDCEGPLLTLGFASGAFGVRTANFTHSRMALRVGTATVLPGSVTVTWRRSALGLAKLFTTHGARFTFPSSPIIRPWLGSSVLVAGGGSEQAR